MQNDRIIIRGARENNLKDISLEIPKHQITVFTGVSGSGKSSLVLDTIAAKSRRELNDTFPTFVQQYLPKYGRPHVDAIENLPIAIVIDQKKPSQNSRSTVATYTDVAALLRLLFSRVGQPFVGYAESFSFNHPEGSCPRCSGLGEIRELDIHKLVDFDKSLNDEDTIHYIAFGKGGWRWIRYAHSGLFDLDKKIRDYTPEELDLFLNSPQIRLKNPPSNWPKTAKYEGLIPRMYRSIINSEEGLLHAAVLNPMLRMGVCPDCGGTRLSPRVLSCKIDGKNIAEVSALSITKVNAWIRSLTSPLAADLKVAIGARLTALEEIGLGYLSLDRAVGTLSGGEAQRCKIAKYINSSLSDVLYILDEPSTGLHNHDIELMKHSVRRLRDAGNTVLLVEHHPEMIRIADHVVDMGPGPGADGGQIVFEGSYDALLHSRTATGLALGAHGRFKEHPRTASRHFALSHATLHNLNDVTLSLPLDVLAVVAGVAGSGKSSLMECFRQSWPTPADVVYVSQKNIGVSLRSTPATYLDVAPDIRKRFAKAHHMKELYFTFNGAGACPVCGGKGVVISEMAFMDNIETVCEACGGLRYSDEALQYTIEGSFAEHPEAGNVFIKPNDQSKACFSFGMARKRRMESKVSLNIAQVFDLSVRRASAFFRGTIIEEKLRPLMDVGLGYLHLNQALSTLSGGELQRLKLASHLGEQGKIFIIDEPTDGLHLRDVHHLIALFERMVDAGNTLYVIEHNIDVIRAADYVVELGPGAGENGGNILFADTPSALKSCPTSVTAPYL
ncbi:MAG: excinuclease ABC subunit UvrA [Bacteroidaceae bacterium]|nr:excinuclease ABC subunit UvrA [Bacteroidaceae bacterium]